MDIYERIYTTSRARGLSIKQLADRVGISDATIYTWKRKGKPNGSTIQKIANELQVSSDYLLGASDTTLHDTPHPIDLYYVGDDERDNLLSANGQAISDDDWHIIKAILAKYPRKD